MSPATLHGLNKDTLEACTVPCAQPVRLDAVVVDAMAATSAALQLPPFGLYLRGVAEAPNTPETFLAWRRDIPALVALVADTASAVLSIYRPAPQELACVRSARSAPSVTKRAPSRRGARPDWADPLRDARSERRGLVGQIPVPNRAAKGRGEAGRAGTHTGASASSALRGSKARGRPAATKDGRTEERKPCRPNAGKRRSRRWTVRPDARAANSGSMFASATGGSRPR